MKRVFYLTFFILLTAHLTVLKSQEVIKNSAISGVCYAGTTVNRIYIPPPDKSYYKSGGSKGKAVAKVTIYPTGFTAEGRAALKRAEVILESFLPPDANVTILAKWERVSTANVLGFSSATGFVGGWAIDAQTPMSYYPVALAEKIAGKSLNSDLSGDIELTINSSAPWYLGTDGSTPSNRYDLVTVVLHELIHGLGFFDSMDVEGNIGSYNPIPLIYDKFIINAKGNRLTDTLKFDNNSILLKDAMTGGKLYFRGPVSVAKTKIWAPSTFDPGSSIAHLDDDSTSIVNSLMTPYVSLGEAIHNPGQLTFSMLGDLGWINTRIIHESPRDTEEHLSELVVSATIASDTTYNRNKVGLVYSSDKFVTSDTVYMTSLNSDDTFNATIGVNYYNKYLQYYIYTEDCFKRIYRSPSLISVFKYSLYIGEDTVKPVITHTKPDYFLETIDTLKLEAFAIDNIGMDSVYVEYKKNNGTSFYAGIPSTGNSGKYTALIRAANLNLNGGDSIRYRIFAVDTSLRKNTSVLPLKGYFSVGIEGLLSTESKYQTDFTSAGPEFFNKGFEISKPSAFTGFGLHSKHPYESPGLTAESIDYISMLRHPLRMNGSGLVINFREIVLVEPGEPGAPFGSSDFYDYVVLEGSSDLGKTWFSLADGYDSRIDASWEMTYNNSIVDQISTAPGEESMLKKHTIFYKPSAALGDGDVFLLRFRLFSDPYANGWGWVIEDFSVTPLIDAIDDISQSEIVVYPNPGNGVINIKDSFSDMKRLKPSFYSIYNMTGTCLINKKSLDGSESIINISGNPEGLYLIVIYRDDGIKTFRYNLIK